MYASAVFVDSDIATFSPTCVFLDYMLLGEKVELGEEQVTILPETYNKQQAQLIVVLGQLVVPKLVSYKSILYSIDHNEATVYEEVHI